MTLCVINKYKKVEFCRSYLNLCEEFFRKSILVESGCFFILINIDELMHRGRHECDFVIVNFCFFSPYYVIRLQT